MTKRKTPADPNRPKKWPTGDYTAGYAKPPKHGQIKPGEVRNPWGPKGKPKDERRDPFEFAASQRVMVTIDGKKVEVDAETAAHLVNMNKAVAGDPRAQKNIQDERRSRRGMGPPPKTAEELRNEMEKEKQQQELSARLVDLLELQSDLSKRGIGTSRNGRFDLAPWVYEAIEMYREKFEVPGDLGAHRVRFDITQPARG